MPPRVHNLLSEDKEIKYLHILGTELGASEQNWSLFFTRNSAMLPETTQLMAAKDSIDHRALYMNDQHAHWSIFSGYRYLLSKKCSLNLERLLAMHSGMGLKL